MPRAPKTKKQIEAATKNILAYEKKDDHRNILLGFVLGSVTVLIAGMVALGIVYSI